MKRQVLIEGYRPGGREVFVSKAPISNGYQPTSSGSTPTPAPPPTPPRGGSAIQKPPRP